MFVIVSPLPCECAQTIPVLTDIKRILTDIKRKWAKPDKRVSKSSQHMDPHGRPALVEMAYGDYEGSGGGGTCGGSGRV